MNWRADRLTDTTIGRRAGPSGSHASWPPARQAVSRTQRPIGTIRPVSSASGMKASGGTRPRVGCCQRTSASNPTISVALEVDDRLVVDAQLVPFEGARRSLSSSMRSSVWALIDGSNSARCWAGSPLARTIAISASRRSSSGVARPGRASGDARARRR